MSPYLNIDDGMDEHPKVEGLSSDAFRQVIADACHWSKTGEATPLVAELVADGLIRRAPRHWLPEDIRPALRHRAKIPRLVRTRVFIRDQWACRHCGTHHNLTLDHIVPWSAGGSDDHTNLQTLCQSCNSRKGARV